MLLLAIINNGPGQTIYVVDDGTKQVQVIYSGHWYLYQNVAVHPDLRVKCENFQHVASLVYAVELVRFIISETKKDK